MNAQFTYPVPVWPAFLHLYRGYVDRLLGALRVSFDALLRNDCERQVLIRDVCGARDRLIVRLPGCAGLSVIMSVMGFSFCVRPVVFARQS